MADIKNINQDRDNSIRGELLTRKDQEAEYEKLDGLQKSTPDLSSNPDAQSFWSTGRGCPKCKRTLAIREVTENSTIIVYCHTCGSVYHHDDLENTSAIGDKINRQIPDDLILRYMAAREEENRKKE